MLAGDIELSEETIRHLKVVSMSEDGITLEHEWRDIKVTIVPDDGRLLFSVKVGDV